MTSLKRIFAPVLLIFIIGLNSCQQADGSQTGSNDIPQPKNIIYFVSDGMGFNHLLATNYYQHGQDKAQVFQQDDWLHLAMATYNSISSIKDGDTIYSTGYNPRMAWQDADYVSVDYAGSAESATAMSTGRKSFSASIGIGPVGDTLTHISQSAKALGKSAGVVTSVPFSHATPAGFAAHVDSRHNYGRIATYMLFNTQLDLIMGAGNPYYDNNGQIREEPNGRYFHSVELWDQLKANDARVSFEVDGNTFVVQDIDGDGQPDPWTVIESREDFLALINANTPKRVLGIPKAQTVLNYGRDMDEDESMPFTHPYNENVPTLEEMTKGALNVLSQNNSGFFVMIEGGAVDWAGHDNKLGRMIEEQIDFNMSVEAAVKWVEQNSSWDETLIIVTSDHETGYLTGPGHPDTVKQQVINKGAGNLPQAIWNSEAHTNQLVPFYAKGPGTHLFKLLAGERDPMRGPFIQNTDVANAIFIMWGKPEIKVHQLN